MLTRRRLLLGTGAAVAGAAAVGVGLDRALSTGSSSRAGVSGALGNGSSRVAGAGRALSNGSSPPLVALGSQPHGLPDRQHAWTATLARDADGNPVSPRFDRLLFFDLDGRPSPAHARVLEAALRTLERRYPWSPSGLLFTAAWGYGYFEHALGVASPTPRAKGLSEFELPAIDDYDLCLHLACNDPDRLAAVEAALVHGEALPGAHGHLALTGALTWRETRTGFVGAGLPAEHQDTGGIPSGRPVSTGAPLFMGFKSNLRKNQATEDAVTISDGPFRDGTTMQVSYMRLRLDSWYGQLNERERIARMYAPQVTPKQVNEFTTDAESDPRLLGQAISRYGVIGHSQTSARARKHGKPLIIRRDFNTVDGGQAGLHFVSIQRSIADFVTTRNAMNAASAQLQNPAITDTVNNGINEFIFVVKRANYILPSRAARSFPLLPGRI
jgi:hypothetical protein